MASFVQDLKSNLDYDLAENSDEALRTDIIATLPVYCDTRLIDQEMEIRLYR